jgi:predicted acylesterase/phospholipase RssA
VTEKKKMDPLAAPADRFCDLVMEGGVTSGVIYAAAVNELAWQYRFRNIGGSSIGAFAAALAAAAEFRRRHGHGDGFDKLAALPDRLASTSCEDEDEEDRRRWKFKAKRRDGRTQLERLFMPQRATRRLFNIFLSVLERSGPISVAVHGLVTAFCQYWAAITVLFVMTAAIMLAGPVLIMDICTHWPSRPDWCFLPLVSLAGMILLIATGSVFFGIVGGVAWDFGWGVVRNGFGLCRGWERGAKADRLDLALFLHAAIQDIAGRAVTDPPLTFRDLWNAPGAPGEALGYPAQGAEARSINLEMYSSNLSHGRPYRFPLEPDEDMGRLFFRVEELEAYFPAGIVHHMAGVSKPYTKVSALDPKKAAVGIGYREVPGPDMPIVVAARLAMSFPLLISAVPLHAVDHVQKNMARCWMSDGGLCSNFPIHLFDSFLPMWPTFGISLRSRDETKDKVVWLPEFHTSGRGELWNHRPEQAFWRTGAFLVSLWKTAWRWNDTTMMRMPGVRDRVVRIYLAPGEGGVNIRMPPERIAALRDEYGSEAGREFIRKFADRGSRGWHEHRWVRFNCLAIALRDRLRHFGKAVTIDQHITPLWQQIMHARVAAPLQHADGNECPRSSEDRITHAQAQELLTIASALCELAQDFRRAGDTRPYHPLPRPSLRMRHPT